MSGLQTIFLPTKSKKQKRDFNAPVGQHVKYGYCHYLKKWVQRDSMLGINVRFYNGDNEQTTVRLRLSPEGWNTLINAAVPADWDNVLKTKAELDAEGAVYED